MSEFKPETPLEWTVIPSQVSLFEGMSQEVGNLWLSYARAHGDLWVLFEARKTGLSVSENGITRPLSNLNDAGKTNEKYDITNELARLFFEVVDFATNEESSYHLDSFLVYKAAGVESSIQTHLAHAEKLDKGIQKALYLNFSISMDLNDYMYGGMLARLYTALALIHDGNFPAPLIAHARHFSPKRFDPLTGNINFLVGDFIESYRRSCCLVLGKEPKVTASIDEALRMHAFKVFGDSELAYRWLNKPSNRYNQKTPYYVAMIGHVEDVLEHLTQIDQGFFA